MASKSDKHEKQNVSFTCSALTSYGGTAHTEAVRTWDNSVVFGANHPGWRRAIARGENAATLMLGKKTTYEAHPGSLSLVLRGQFDGPTDPDTVLTSRGIHLPGRGLPSPSIDLSEADNRAKIDFLLHCKDTQTSFQGGVFLGELRETIELIRSPLHALHRRTESFLKEQKLLARGVRRLPTKLRAGAIKKAVGEGWLTYSFGIRPLISDIDSAFEALSEATHPSRPISVPVRGKGKKVASEQVGIDSSGFGFEGTDGQGTLVSKEVREVRYYGKVRLPVDQFPRIQSLFGFSQMDVLPTIWELIPWSFLADYFSNIGNVLAAWSFDQASLEWVNKGSKTVAQNIYQDIRQIRPYAPGPSFPKLVYSGSPGYVNWKYSEVQREIVSERLWPSFSVELPERHRLGKLMNSVSLLFTRGGSKSPYARLG